MLWNREGQQSFRGANLMDSGFDPEALTQATWHVNALTGSDVNAGTSQEPLKTLGELFRRWGVGNTLFPQGNTLTVNIDSDLPNSDGIGLRYTILSALSNLVFQGRSAIVRAGTLSGVTPINRSGTPSPFLVTDATMLSTWSADLGRRIRMVSGAAIGAIFWVGQDMGAKTARVSPPVQTPAPGSGSYIVTPVMPAPGDNYVVETLSHCVLDELAIGGDYGQGFPTVTFVDLDLGEPGGGLLPPIAPSASVFFIDCRLQCQPIPEGNQNVIFVNCSFEDGGPFAQNGSQVIIQAGLVRAVNFPNELTASSGSVVTIDADMLSLGVPLLANFGQLAVGYAGVFDVAGGLAQNPDNAGVSVGNPVFGGGALTVAPIAQGGSALYGNGHAGPGLSVGPFGKAGYSGTLPTITGTGGDLLLAGANTGRAWDEVGGTYGAAEAATWSNVSTHGNLWNVGKGAGVVKSVP